MFSENTINVGLNIRIKLFKNFIFKTLSFVFTFEQTLYPFHFRFLLYLVCYFIGYEGLVVHKILILHIIEIPYSQLVQQSSSHHCAIY